MNLNPWLMTAAGHAGLGAARSIAQISIGVATIAQACGRLHRRA